MIFMDHLSRRWLYSGLITTMLVVALPGGALRAGSADHGQNAGGDIFDNAEQYLDHHHFSANGTVQGGGNSTDQSNTDSSSGGDTGGSQPPPAKNPPSTDVIKKPDRPKPPASPSQIVEHRIPVAQRFFPHDARGKAAMVAYLQAAHLIRRQYWNSVIAAEKREMIALNIARRLRSIKHVPGEVGRVEAAIALLTLQIDRDRARRTSLHHFYIFARLPWQPTIAVKAGEAIHISAQGTWTPDCRQAALTCTANGPTSSDGAMARGVLIAQVGDAAPIKVGTNGVIRVHAAGVLYLEQYDDGERSQSGGAVRVRIRLASSDEVASKQAMAKPEVSVDPPRDTIASEAAIILKRAIGLAEKQYWLAIVNARFAEHESLQVAAERAATAKKVREVAELTLLTQHVQDRWLVAKRESLGFYPYRIAARPDWQPTFYIHKGEMVVLRAVGLWKADNVIGYCTAAGPNHYATHSGGELQVRVGRHGTAGRPGVAKTFNAPTSGLLSLRMNARNKAKAQGAIAVWLKRSYPFELVP